MADVGDFPELFSGTKNKQIVTSLTELCSSSGLEMMLEVKTILLLVSAAGWAGVAGGVHCPAGMTEVEEVGCLALHHQEYERMEWKDCRQFCWETYLAHLGK